MRKIGIVLVGIMILLLAACGTENADRTGEKQTVTSPESTGTETADTGETTDVPAETGTVAANDSTSVTGVEDLTEEEKNTTYGVAVTTNPELVLPAEDWITEDGTIWYPFDPADADCGATQLSAKCYIAKSLLKEASTENLIALIEGYGPADAYAYESPAFYYDHISQYLNLVPELRGRDDLAETLLSLYREAGLDETSVWSDENDLAVLEMLLARDEVYEQLTEEERSEVVTIAGTLLESRAGLENIQKKDSAFFTSVYGYQILETGEKWYAELSSGSDSVAKEQLKEFWE